MTVSKVNTLAQELDNGNPNRLGPALAKAGLGTILTPKTYDTGTITGVASITVAALVAAHYANIPAAPPANTPRSLLALRSLRVVTSATGASLGTYILSDSGAAPLLPPGGASTAVGIATISDDGTTITFPNTVTRIIASFVPGSVTDVSQAFGEP